MMGVSIYVSLEKEIAGIDPLAINGKPLSQAVEVLDEWAQTIGLTPLMEMVSSPPEEIAELMDVDLEDLPKHLVAEQWFAAADGLRTIRGMIEHLRLQSAAIKASGDVLTDLQDIETVLMAAELAQVRFHFSLDF
jgi:hypothetical protein